MVDKIISTGEMLKGYMEENGVSVSALAIASDVSERSIYRLLNGECKLSRKIALGMNSLIPEISVEFLMMYDAKYQAQCGSTVLENKTPKSLRGGVHRNSADSGKTVKKNCTVPLWLCMEAEKANINFSKALQKALKEELGI